MSRELIYFDHAATTPIREEVLNEMLPYFRNNFGNPSSIYAFGRESKKAIELSRERVAKAINADSIEIFFTSGGTEADNWAVKGIINANKKKGRHIITTSIEHHAILHTCARLENEGFEVTYLPVDNFGRVDIKKLRAVIRDDTILITVMFANNEIGTIQPVKQIAELAKEKGIYFHTDAVQAVGNIKVDVKDLGVDLLSLSGHKLYGPKGIGALYVKKGVKLHSLIEGGGQENKKRAGTENVPGIIGIGKAIEIASQRMDVNRMHMKSLRDRTIDYILKNISNTWLNGHPIERLPGNANFSFEGVEGKSLLTLLERKGIAASSGSACTAGSLHPSHVLLATAFDNTSKFGALRLTFGEENTQEDITYLLRVLPNIIDKLRKI